MIITANENLISAAIGLTELNIETIESAKGQFNVYKDSGVIKNNTYFEDSLWYCTDEYANISLNYSIDIANYIITYAPIFGFDSETFTSYLKTFSLSLFGRVTLTHIQDFLRDVRTIISLDLTALHTAIKDLRLVMPNDVEDFLSVIPCDDARFNDIVELISNAADYSYSTCETDRRCLSTFLSYFLFEDIITDFWQRATLEQKCFYYPLYIWWKLTGIVPLRPCEFIVTKRDCLITSNEKHYLVLRRNQLKGNNGKEVRYKISADYREEIVEIPDSIYTMFTEYIELTKNYDRTDIDTLFVTDIHYLKWGQKKHKNSRYLTYINLNTILKYFYREIIIGEYGYTVIHTGEDNIDIGQKRIEKIHLGDTRHIALINAMESGCTPVMAMMLAGHSNVNTTAHYFLNIERMLQCNVLRQRAALTEGRKAYSIAPYAPLPKNAEGIPLSIGGSCYSSEYAAGSVKDCLNIMGSNGEIGFCPRCPFYRKSGFVSSETEDLFRRNLKDDIEALKTAVDVIRSGKSDEISSVGESIQRHLNSSLSYQQYLIEKEDANAEA